jgi:hypothetical protein
MTKGEKMSEEDRLLEEGKSTKWYWFNQQQENSTSIATSCIDEDDDRYLFNINPEGNE